MLYQIVLTDNFLKNSGINWDKWTAIGTICLAAATIFLAIGTAALVYITYRNWRKDKKKEESKFYLEKYILVAEMILERLQSDKPTRRVAWVTAADLANKLEIFERKVTMPADLYFLEVYKRNYAHLIYDFLCHKMAVYFYGVDEAIDLDDAASKCRPYDGKVVAGPVPKLVSLDIDEGDIKSILRLFSRISQASEYPLFNKNGEVSMIVLMVNFGELFLYLDHREKWQHKKMIG